MIPELIERAVLDIRDRMLRPQFNAMLEIAYAQAADPTINLERVPDSRYYISEAIEPLQPPAIFIVSDESEHDLEWQNAAMQTHSIIVGAVIEDIEVQRLVKKAWRYAQALHATLHDRGTQHIRVLVRGIGYGPVLVKGAADVRAFRKDITLRCDVLHAEAFALTS